MAFGGEMALWHRDSELADVHVEQLIAHRPDYERAEACSVERKARAVASLTGQKQPLAVGCLRPIAA